MLVAVQFTVCPPVIATHSNVWKNNFRKAYFPILTTQTTFRSSLPPPLDFSACWEFVFWQGEGARERVCVCKQGAPHSPERKQITPTHPAFIRKDKSSADPNHRINVYLRKVPLPFCQPPNSTPFSPSLASPHIDQHESLPHFICERASLPNTSPGGGERQQIG